MLGRTSLKGGQGDGEPICPFCVQTELAALAAASSTVSEMWYLTREQEGSLPAATRCFIYQWTTRGWKMHVIYFCCSFIIFVVHFVVVFFLIFKMYFLHRAEVLPLLDCHKK